MFDVFTMCFDVPLKCLCCVIDAFGVLLVCVSVPLLGDPLAAQHAGAAGAEADALDLLGPRRLRGVARAGPRRHPHRPLAGYPRTARNTTRQTAYKRDWLFLFFGIQILAKCGKSFI